MKGSGRNLGWKQMGWMEVIGRGGGVDRGQ